MFAGGLVGHAHVNVVHGHTQIHIPAQPNNHNHQPFVGQDGHDHDDDGDDGDIGIGIAHVDEDDGPVAGMPSLEPAASEPADLNEDDEWEDEEDFFDVDDDQPDLGEHDLDHDGEYCCMLSFGDVG